MFSQIKMFENIDSICINKEVSWSSTIDPPPGCLNYERLLGNIGVVINDKEKITQLCDILSCTDKCSQKNFVFKAKILMFTADSISHVVCLDRNYIFIDGESYKNTEGCKMLIDSLTARYAKFKKEYSAPCYKDSIVYGLSLVIDELKDYFSRSFECTDNYVTLYFTYNATKDGKFVRVVNLHAEPEMQISADAKSHIQKVLTDNILLNSNKFRTTNDWNQMGIQIQL